MPTIAEQLTAFETKRAALVAANENLINKSAEEGATLDEAQQEEFDNNAADLESLDGHIKRIRTVERSQAAQAKPARGANAAEGSETRSPRIEVKTSQVAKGTAFTRYVIALARSKGNLMQAAEIAKTWSDSTPEVETILKAAVAAGTTTDPAWAGPLVQYQNMASEFVELLRPATIIGRVPGLRSVPFNVKIPRQTAGSNAEWVGQGLSKPVSALAFDQITLGMTKVAGIVVITDELARSSSPAAETVIRQDLADTIIARVDNDFVDPTHAAVANVAPGSITNGIAGIPSAGTTDEDARADVQALFAEFNNNEIPVAGSVFITTEIIALQLAMMQNVMGQPAFPGMSALGSSGASLLGLPVVASANVPNGVLILVKPSEILIADDGQTTIDVSREASLQLDGAPTSPPTGMVSLWQQNMVGIRAERYINWTKRRAAAVAWISGADYTGVVPVGP